MMKKIITSLLLGGFYFSAFSAVPYVVIKNDINARIDSTVSSDSIGVLTKGEEVEVLAENFNWYKIKLPKRFSCYIAKDFVKKTDNDTIKVTASNVNLRKKPSLEAAILGKVSKGAVLKLIKENSEWVKVRGYPYVYGWVHKQFLKKAKETPLETDDSAEPYCEDCSKANTE